MLNHLKIALISRCLSYARASEGNLCCCLALGKRVYKWGAHGGEGAEGQLALRRSVHLGETIYIYIYIERERGIERERDIITIPA